MRPRGHILGSFFTPSRAKTGQNKFFGYFAKYFPWNHMKFWSSLHWFQQCVEYGLFRIWILPHGTKRPMYQDIDNDTVWFHAYTEEALTCKTPPSRLCFQVISFSCVSIASVYVTVSIIWGYTKQMETISQMRSQTIVQGFNISLLCNTHDDVIKWKRFPRYWPFVHGIHQSPVNSPHKGLWCGALMYPLICAWINIWLHNREAGDLRHHRAHYDVTVMAMFIDVWFDYGVVRMYIWRAFYH